MPDLITSCVCKSPTCSFRILSHVHGTLWNVQQWGMRILEGYARYANTRGKRIPPAHNLRVISIAVKRSICFVKRENHLAYMSPGNRVQNQTDYATGTLEKASAHWTTIWKIELMYVWVLRPGERVYQYHSNSATRHAFNENRKKENMHIWIVQMTVQRQAVDDIAIVQRSTPSIRSHKKDLCM